MMLSRGVDFGLSAQAYSLQENNTHKSILHDDQFFGVGVLSVPLPMSPFSGCFQWISAFADYPRASFTVCRGDSDRRWPWIVRVGSAVTVVVA